MDLHASFVRDQQRRGLREGTITTRRRIIWSLGKAIDGGFGDVSGEDIETWLDSLRLSSRSRYTYLSAVASFYEFLRRRGVVENDPTLDIVRPRLARLVPRPAPSADIEYAIEGARPMMRAWLCLAAYQGLRCFEIANLRREDIQEHRDPPLLVVADGKGGRQDVLALNEQVELALRLHGLRAGYLFTTNDGRRFKPATVSRYISRYLRSVGVEATAHQLRHAFITAVWQQTKDLRVTQEIARHSDPRTTSGYAAFDTELATRTVRSLRLGGERLAERVN